MTLLLEWFKNKNNFELYLLLVSLLFVFIDVLVFQKQSNYIPCKYKNKSILLLIQKAIKNKIELNGDHLMT